MNRKFNIWNHTFKVVVVFNNPFTNNQTTIKESYKGSLLATMKYYLEKYRNDSVVVSFYTESDCFLKEIGW